MIANHTSDNFLNLSADILRQETMKTADGEDEPISSPEPIYGPVLGPETRFFGIYIGASLVVLGLISFYLPHNFSSTALITVGVIIAFAPLLGFYVVRQSTPREIPLVILLLRHGESTANVDPAVYETTPDHAIPLSERGQAQTLKAGAKLAEFLLKRFGLAGSKSPAHSSGTGSGGNSRKNSSGRIPCKLLVSPFRRTRETASILLKTELGDWVTDVRESSLLVEQDWG
jgi:hypothetical protein